MKTKLHYVIITLITGILLSSCSNNMSLMKRKYNKGYYIAHSHKINEPKQTEPVMLVKKESAIKELQTTVAEPELKNNTSVSEQPTAMLPQTELTHAKQIKHSAFKSNLLQHSFKIVERVAPKKMQAQLRAKAPEAGLVAATLSLFWIVLVVILVIYLLGLAFNEFGIGNIFHLLAVIFLVLLVLWLLGIV
jgi:hypothetical protein